MSDQKRIEDWILDYGLHGPDERKRVESFVVNHPEWDDCFESAKQWEALLGDARRLNDPSKDDEHLPYAVASWSLPHAEEPSPLRRLLSRILGRSDGNSELASKRFLYENRRSEADSTTHVARHFEWVTGHRIREGSIAPEISPVRHLEPRRRHRSPAPSRLPIVRKFVRSVALVAGMYLLLFTASTVRDAPFERIAHLNSYDYSWTGLGVSARGNDEEWEKTMVDRYNTALSVAASARRSFLGLFPTYRANRIRTARDLLQESIDFQLSREPVPPHAYLTLAKLHFLLGDSLRSLDALREVILQDEQRVQRPATSIQLY